VRIVVVFDAEGESEGKVNMDKAIHHDGYRRLVGRLKDARLRQGLDQVEVARQVGHSRQWLSKVERNCSGSRPRAGGYLREVGGLGESGAWARITRC